MTRKSQTLLVIAAVLAGVYAYYFTDWVNTPRIQIIKSDRPGRSGRSRGNVHPITFTFDGRYALTAVKVISTNALATNQHPQPLWHLVAKDQSEPVKGFLYGQPIGGMQPAVANARPQPLEPNVTYRLLVEAGRSKGALDFQAVEAPGP